MRDITVRYYEEPNGDYVLEAQADGRTHAVCVSSTNLGSDTWILSAMLHQAAIIWSKIENASEA